MCPTPTASTSAPPTCCPTTSMAQVKAGAAAARPTVRGARSTGGKGAGEGPEERRCAGPSWQRARRAEQPAKRIKELEEAVKLDPSSAALHLPWRRSGSRGGNRRAEAAFRKAVETNPKSPISAPRAGEFLWSSGRGRRGRASLKTAVELEPANLRQPRARHLLPGDPPGREAEPHLKALADGDTSPGAQPSWRWPTTTSR